MKDLSKEQVNILKKHKSVERITSKHVVFSFEFKIKAVTNYLGGTLANETFASGQFYEK